MATQVIVLSERVLAKQVESILALEEQIKSLINKENEELLEGVLFISGLLPDYDKDKLYELSRILCLSEDETNTMFDLAAGEKENTVSPDLPEYIMGNEQVRVALRMARDNNASSEVWQKVIEMMEEQERGKK